MASLHRHPRLCVASHRIVPYFLPRHAAAEDRKDSLEHIDVDRRSTWCCVGTCTSPRTGWTDASLAAVGLPACDEGLLGHGGASGDGGRCACGVSTSCRYLLDQIDDVPHIVRALSRRRHRHSRSAARCARRADCPFRPRPSAVTLIAQCLNVNEKHVLGRLPPFARLADARVAAPARGGALSERRVSRRICWSGFTSRGSVNTSAQRSASGQHSSRANAVTQLADRRVLVTIIWRTHRLDRRAVSTACAGAADRTGRVTAGASDSAAAARFRQRRGKHCRHAPLPAHRAYPGGAERVRWHLARCPPCVRAGISVSRLRGLLAIRRRQYRRRRSA